MKDIDFTSAKKLKENLDNKIDSWDEHTATPMVSSSETLGQAGQPKANSPSAEEMAVLFEKLNQCKIKPVALSLVGPYADQFVAKSRTVPVVTDLYVTGNLGLKYPELLKKCLNVKIDLSNEDISQVEQDTRSQAKGSGFFRHRAGRIGASVCGAVFHSNLAQPPQSLIKTICFPNLFKVNTKAVRHGCQHEDDAIKAY